ncbi:hypothetical protein ACHAWF_004318 [Thalassiosira exigua]
MAMIKFLACAALLSGDRGSLAFAPSASRTISSRHAGGALYSTSASSDEESLSTADDGGRRTFLSSSAIALMATSGLIAQPSPADAAFSLPFGLGSSGGGSTSSADYKAVASDIASLIKKDPNKGPTLVRLAWHSSGTYDKMSKDGGSGGGTIRFKEELAHGGNAGLGSTAVVWMEDIKKKYGDSISYADLYTLAGVVAIKELGGPTIPWSSGRVDALDPSAVTPDGRLPNADVGPAGTDPDDAAHLRTIFGRMGFNDQEVCVSILSLPFYLLLSHAHTVDTLSPSFRLSR